MSLRKVTVICLCYNQGRFVDEAIKSVLQQTYPEVELLLVDDASTDDSVSVIMRYVREYPQIKFFPLTENSGNCKAFNHALYHATGDYIIDLAADDILLPERVAKGVEALEKAGERYGVNFSDALAITEDKKILYRHSDRFPHASIPEGDIYRKLIAWFFICSPTMMFRTSVIRSLGGYDETLRYEDFDFWIRSSRNFYYCYTPDVLVKKRVVRNSMSHRQFTFFNPQLRSTFMVCEKILALNRNTAEQRVLRERILYEVRVCVRLLHFPLLFDYARLYFRTFKRFQI